MGQQMRTEVALRLLHDVSLGQVRAGMPDLTPRQLAILTIIYLDAPPHTVRGLASRLDVTKRVITRALDSMGKLGLVTRRRDDRDRRNVIISRTVEGTLYLEKLADMLAEAAEKAQ